MPGKRKTLRTVRTMAALTDRRRSRTAPGAFLELATMANEKERLNRELAAINQRTHDIRLRLGEIAEKETRLQKFIKDPDQVAHLLSDFPTEEGFTHRVRAREITY